MAVSSRQLKTAGAVAGSLVGLWLLLSIPGAEPPVAPAPERGRGFAWNQDTLWRSLETTYVHTRVAGCGTADRAAAGGLSGLAATAEQLLRAPVPSGAAALDSVERRFFALAPLVAACPHHLRDYVRLSGRLREAIKWQSRRWDVASDGARARLYRSLYGFRGAVEEAMLQHPDSSLPLVEGRREPSATPATNVHGVEIHSGDILVSRGGYPTSALIARGNDYPGNFSHVGLVHVDSASHAASVIEAHIERGVAVSTADGYLRDKKLRIMVLRLRADLAPLIADPSLPHRAASLALERARSGHIAYDFEMDYTDPSRLFCSEVASSVYGELGVRLWTGLSTISAAGLRRWWPRRRPAGLASRGTRPRTGFSLTWPEPQRRRCAGRVRRRSFSGGPLLPGVRAMPKGEERKLAALAKKNAAKAAKAKPNKRRQYDDTLPPEREEDVELRDFFSEMKKREF